MSSHYRGIPIISTDSEATQGFDSMGRGYDAALAKPAGFAAPLMNVVRIPRAHWSDRIKEQEAKRTSVEHWCQVGDVKITNQRGYGYCWCYGTVGAIMARYAMEGIKAPYLNAFYPAYLGKGGRNQGGWAGEALEYIDKYGIPEWGVFTDQPTARNAFERAEVKASAEKHKVASFLELPRNDVEALISVLLADHPLPVTLGLSWWGHLVYATRVLETSPGVFGILFRNSWDYSYGDNGRGILTLNKAVAFEQIAIDLNYTVAA